jgi:hypothetical protein
MWQLGGGRNVVGGTGEFGVALPESVSGRMTPTRDWRLLRLVCQAQREFSQGPQLIGS